MIKIERNQPTGTDGSDMAFGSRGDVQPFLALAAALRERGHNVTLAAPSDFEAQINAYHIPAWRGNSSKATTARVTAFSP